MAKLEIFDGVYFNYVGIDNNSTININENGTSDDSFVKALDTNLYNDKLSWGQNTVLLANFSNDISGSNFDGSYSGIDHFEIYKQAVGESVLHKVYRTQNGQETIIEDFVVDGHSEYVYYVYPVCLVDEKNQLYTVSSPFSASITNDSAGYVSIIGLVQNEDNIGEYNINESEVWKFEFNIENSGTTLTMDKRFADTQHRFPKTTGGNRKYNKANVKGLIGKCDCKFGYEDSNTLIKEWETFAVSNCLKLFKDIRGRLMLCEIDSSSIEYMDCYPYPASVSFSITEIENLDNIEISGRAIPYNAAKTMFLADRASNLLQEAKLSCLSVPY